MGSVIRGDIRCETRSAARVLYNVADPDVKQVFTLLFRYSFISLLISFELCSLNTDTMRLLLQFSSLAVALAASSAVAALPCVVFDNQFNLYAFGGSKDWSLGQQDSWPGISFIFTLFKY